MAVDKKAHEETRVLNFYRNVLSWDYVRLLNECDQSARSLMEGNAPNMKEVKDTYQSVDDYISTFEPLLFEEVKAQIAQSRSNDGVIEWRMGLIREFKEANEFQFPVIGYAADDGGSLSHNDLLLISKEKFQDGMKLPKTYAFALVEHRQTDLLRVRMFLSGEVKQNNPYKISPSPRLMNMQDIVSEINTSLWILKVCGLSTIVREYNALQCVGLLLFKDVIFSASQSNLGRENGTWKISKPLMEILENEHNESQLAAIHAGLSRKTFVLIQGPPGTGKTKTILGLLSAVLHATPDRMHSNIPQHEARRPTELCMEDKYNHWIKASPWLTGVSPRDEIFPIDGDDGFFLITGNELKPEVVTSKRKYRVRVLVCAPSNSALDEIVLRILSTGVRDENGHHYPPKIVRIGINPHHSVRAVSMDYLVEQKFGGPETTSNKQKQGVIGRDRDSLRASVLDEATIVFSTLGFSGSIPFNKLNHGFDIVIIDEAAQAVEPSTLVPLSHGCKQVFLVGDPVQLPATVISPVSSKFGYGISLFERLHKAGYPVQMLKTQYRMHPEIRSFPSMEFYSEELEDGPDVKDRTERSWHNYRCFGPFCFFDIHEGKESRPPGGSSWVNMDEVEFVLLMHLKMVNDYPELKSSDKMAIISPYREQVKLFRDRFQDIFGSKWEEVIDINTVDGFQGREKDVAIFSCVRANEDKGIGFVKDFRRMNVGITRARSTVLVVGCASTLKKGDEHWKNLIESAEKRKSLFQVSKPFSSFLEEENLKSMEIENAREETGNVYEDEIEGRPDYGNVEGGGEPDQHGDDDGEGYGDMDEGGDD